MDRHIAACVLMASLIALALGPHQVSATGGGPGKPLFGGTPIVGPPVGNPRPVPGSHHPLLIITGHLAKGTDQNPAYPSDFSFTDRLTGAGFKAGESIQIEVSGEAPLVTRADNDGTFAATVRFTWVFCGAGGAASPAPIIRATGDQGSTAQAREQPRPCPVVVVKRQTGTFVLHGFGFDPQESITVHAMGRRASVTGLPAHTTADGHGYFRLVIPAFTPIPCGSARTGLVARGQHRGAVAVRLPVHRPFPACPVHGGTP